MRFRMQKKKMQVTFSYSQQQLVNSRNKIPFPKTFFYYCCWCLEKCISIFIFTEKVNKLEQINKLTKKACYKKQKHF